MRGCRSQEELVLERREQSERGRERKKEKEESCGMKDWRWTEKARS